MEFLEQIMLGFDVRMCDRYCKSRLIESGAANDSLDVVLIVDSIFKLLDDESGYTFGPAIAICRRIIGLAPAIRTESDLSKVRAS